MFEYSYQRIDTGGFGSPVVPTVYCKMYVDGGSASTSVVACLDGQWLRAMHRAKEIATAYWVDAWMDSFFAQARHIVARAHALAEQHPERRPICSFML